MFNDIVWLSLYLSLVSWSSGSFAQPYYRIEHQMDGTYRGPLLRVNQDEVYEAYRYGSNQYDVFEGRARDAVADLQREMRLGAANSAEIDKLRLHNLQELKQRPSTLSERSNSLGTRRAFNPVPRGTNAETLSRIADSLWRDIRKNDLFALEEDLSTLQLQLTLKSEAERDFVVKDLAFSNVINRDGILDLPFAPLPTRLFHAAQSSPFGREMRVLTNRAQVSKSLVGQSCAKTPTLECSDWSYHINDAMEAVYSVDRAVWIDGGEISKVSQILLENVRETIETTLSFVKGAATGAMGAGIDMAVGIGEVVAHPIKTVSALAMVITKRAEVWDNVKKDVLRVLAELGTAPAERRGEIIGRAVAELTLFRNPAACLMAGTGEMLGLGTAAAYEGLSHIVASSSKMSRLATRFEVRAMMAANHLKLDGQASQKFVIWAGKYLDHADDGALLISFARNMTVERYDALVNVQQKLGTSISENAHRYLVRRAIYEGQGLTPGRMETLGRKAHQIEAGLHKIKGVKVSHGIEVTRTVYEAFTNKINWAGKNTLESAVILHEGGLLASHRYSMRGELAQYFVIGADATAEALSKAEIEFTEGSRIVTARAVIAPKNMLVLSKSMVHQLDLAPRDLTTRTYELTQTLGHFARKQGFDALMVPSKINSQKNNLITFGIRPVEGSIR